MPKPETRDVEHAVYTDHSIPRGGGPSAAGSGAPGQLVPFWRGDAGERETALATAIVAMTEPAFRRPALEQLQKAVSTHRDDAPLSAQLAQFYDRLGRPALALPLYERVRALDPANTAALINLGSLYAHTGRLGEAVEVWQDAPRRNPALTQARLNVAVAQLRSGERVAGLASLRKALEYDPDSEPVRKMLQEASR